MSELFANATRCTSDEEDLGVLATPIQCKRKFWAKMLYFSRQIYNFLLCELGAWREGGPNVSPCVSWHDVVILGRQRRLYGRKLNCGGGIQTPYFMGTLALLFLIFRIDASAYVEQMAS